MGVLNSIQNWFHRRMPSREDMAGNRYLAPIAHRFLSPELWRFTRRSVPRGVALGLFSGFIIPIGQIFLAAFLALPARANVPVATVVTFVTNPFTLPFWLIVANRVGRFFLKIDQAGVGVAISKEMSSKNWEGYSWFFETAGVTAVGFVIMAVISAALGYIVSGWIWRAWVGRKLRVKQERHRAAREAAE